MSGPRMSIWRMLRHEWRMLTSDATLAMIAVVFLAAIAYGAWNGVRWVRFQTDAIAAATQEERTRFAQHEAAIARLTRENAKVPAFADPRNPASAGGRFGARYAVLPPLPVAPLAIGQSDLLPYYVKTTTDAKETVTSGTELENPQRLLSGRLDLAFVLIYLYPLLILAISYNLLSAEHEQGTLALVLSQPVSLQRLMVAKVAVRFLVLLATVIGCATIALLISGVNVMSPDVAARLPLWLAAIAVYGAFWFALAIAIASLGRPSATNAMLLAGAWLLFVVLLPSAFNLLVTSVFPVPSRVEMVQAVRDASDDANRQGSELLARYYEDHPELAVGGAEQAMNDFNVIRVAVGAEVEQRVRPVLDRYERQLASQQRMIDRLRLLSPAILMQDAINDIAGTGTARHRHFMAQVTRYHEAWRQFFVPRIVQRAQLATFGDIPVFRWEEESMRQVVGRVGLSIGSIALPALLLAAAGLAALRRFAVTA
jgi:ABC-2 type transport system permease protein